MRLCIMFAYLSAARIGSWLGMGEGCSLYTDLNPFLGLLCWLRSALTKTRRTVTLFCTDILSTLSLHTWSAIHAALAKGLHLYFANCRRHISLLRSLVPDGTSSIIPVHTILEVYQVSDMSLVCVLPSAEDEVNAAAFHPHPVSL